MSLSINELEIELPTSESKNTERDTIPYLISSDISQNSHDETSTIKDLKHPVPLRPTATLVSQSWGAESDIIRKTENSLQVIIPRPIRLATRFTRALKVVPVTNDSRAFDILDSTNSLPQATHFSGFHSNSLMNYGISNNSNFTKYVAMEKKQQIGKLGRAGQADLNQFAAPAMELSKMQTESGVSQLLLSLSQASSPAVNSTPDRTIMMPKNASTGRVRCYWSDCRDYVDSLDDLIAHLYLNHIYDAPTTRSCYWTDRPMPQSPSSAATQAASLTSNSSSAFDLLLTASKVQTVVAPTRTTISIHDLLDHSDNSPIRNFTAPQSVPTVNPPNMPKLSGTSEIPRYRCDWEHCHQDGFETPLTLLIHIGDAHITPGLLKDYGPNNPMTPKFLPTIPCRWQYCGARFVNSSELSDHVTAVHIPLGSSVYQCRWGAQCCAAADSGQVLFNQRQKLVRHVQKHTGDRPFSCPMCYRRFSEMAICVQHQRTHTGEKPYKCDFPGCNRQFAIPGTLTIHRRRHNGERPFVCQVCDKRFAESSNLKKHVRTHTGEKPFHCKYAGCEMSFSRPDQVARHMRNRHETQ